MAYAQNGDDLYFIASANTAWEDLSSWNTAADGSGLNPSSPPWVDGAYVDSNLHDATNYTTAAYNSSYISGNAICDLYIVNYGTINGGSFTIQVDNYSVINGGTFSFLINKPSTNAVINYAVVTSGIENYVSCTIYDGIYSGYVFNGYIDDGGHIDGGTYNIDSFLLINGTINFPNIQTTSGGDPYTGNWLGQVWDYGSWAGVLPIGDLYFTNARGDGEWSNTYNWNTAADGSGINPSEIPWSNTDGSTSDSYLSDVSGISNIRIEGFSGIDANITGVCDIPDLVVNSDITISGGTFTGDRFYTQGIIDGGNFSGDSLNNSSLGTINGGTFTGNNFTNYLSYIYGGNFSGNNFSNTYYSEIHGGTFSGINFTNFGSWIYDGTFLGDNLTNSGSTINGGTFSGNNFINDNGYIYGGTFTGSNFANNAGEINGGTFEITGFTNSATIDFPSIQITSGDPYTGNWLGQVWDYGSWAGVLPIGDLYFTNARGDGEWSNTYNWNTAADGSGINPSEIPWTNTDGFTNASNLYDATGGAGITISNYNTYLYGSDNSTCYIDYVSNYGQISTGTWTGANITNYLYADNLTITGDNFLNLNEIGYGTFTGNNMTNNGTIDASGVVLCSGDNFVNTGLIFGGTFSNNGFTNQYGSLLNATFTGTNFDNSYGIVANCDIRGGFNNVPNGFDLYNYVYYEFAFAQIGQVFDTYFSGPSTGTTSGPLGSNYVYADSIGAIKYPTPTGSNGVDLARLIGLPAFIQL